MGPDVCNAAEGGATALDLVPHAAGAAVEEDDLVVFSVGTNDAAPCKQVPVTAYAQAVRRCMRAVPCLLAVGSTSLRQGSMSLD